MFAMIRKLGLKIYYQEAATTYYLSTPIEFLII